MDVTDAVTTEFDQFEPTTPVSKIAGAFKRTRARALPIVRDGEFEGIVTRKQLLSSHHATDEHASTIMRDDVPRIDPNEDVRETARLMVESGLSVLPVFEGGRFSGVVTIDALLRLVRTNLDAVTVNDVATYDLVSIESDTSLGKVINVLREHRISRVPVVEDGEARGMVSLYDLVDFVTREVKREQGGDVAGFDSHQGSGSSTDFSTHRGGWGERAGEQSWLLDLPARNVMTEPAATISPDTPLGEAVERMLDDGRSSFVVTGDPATPLGIVTTTDAIRALTWTDEESFDVQIFGIDLVDDLSREAIADRLLEIDGKYAAMDVLEANVIFHEHDETQRGVPLLLATIRLFTDEGRFSGNGEGYGATNAFREAAERLERNVLDEKSRGREKKKSRESRERTERLLGWWLEG